MASTTANPTLVNDSNPPLPNGWMIRFILIVMAAFLLVGALSTWWMVRQSEQHMREDLLHQVRQVAQAVDIERILALSGSDSDLTTVDYLRLKRQLFYTRKAITGSKSIYIMGRRKSGTVFFFAGSEPPGSENEFSAGRIYEEISQADLRVFEERVALVSGPANGRWGTCISALVPLTDPDSNSLIAVLGVDFAVRDWQRKLTQVALTPILVTLAMLVLFAVGAYVINRRARCADPALKHTRYRLTILVMVLTGLFLSLTGAWMANEQSIHTRHLAFWQLAQEKATSLARKLNTLAHIELESLARLFEASEYVSTKEFNYYTDYLLKNPIVRTWAWAQWVPASDRERMEMQVRSKDLPGFSIWQWDSKGDRLPVAKRESGYYPITRAAPIERKREILGFDLASDPSRQRAVKTASSNGLTTSSAPLDMPGETDRRVLIQLLRPVFAQGDNAQLRGFALADLEPTVLVSTALPTDTVLLELSISDNEMGFEHLAASWTKESFRDPRLSMLCPIFVFGQVFLVTAHAGTVFLELFPAHVAWLVLITGLALTALITSWFGVVYRKREQLEQLVDERTRDLRESERRLRTLIDTLPDLVWLKDPQGIYLFCNKRFERLYGAKEADIVGKTDYDFTDRAVADFFSEKDRAAMEAKRACLNEENVTYADDGHREIVETIKTPMVDAQGEITGVLGISRDITNRKRAQEQLLLSEEKFSKVFTLAPDLIAITRLKDGLITDVNIGFEAITGWKKSEVIGRRTIDFQFWDNPSIRSEIAAELKAGQDILRRDIQFRRKDGAVRNGVYSARVIGLDDEQYIILVVQDVTDNRVMEADRRKLEAQLQQSQKLEAVGILAGGVAHDFNNMLGAIIGYAEMAMMELGSDDPMRKNLNRILDAAERSASLTRQLLTFARKQTVEPMVLDLNSAIEDTLKMLRRLIGENIELAWLPVTGACSVCMDPSQLDQILANLCVNARDAIADVGKITIKTDTTTFDESACGVYADCAPGAYARLSIGDNGCGMDLEIQNRVFEPFFTTKEIGRGTGLGLATVYGIVKQNNGFIQLSSEPGIGTTFSIYLPLYVADADFAAANKEDVISLSQGETILMVEDDATLREMGQVMLQRLGYRVLVAATPGTAIRIAEEEDDIHLFLIDVIMPEMNGRELADRLLAIRPGIKHLFMSGYTADIIAHQGVLDNGINFIQKPFTVKDLGNKLRDILGQCRAGT